MRRVRFSKILLFSVPMVGLLTGCGMIRIPQQKTLPNQNLRIVEVQDLDTGKPLGNASVTYRIVTFRGTIKPPPLCWIETESDFEEDAHHDLHLSVSKQNELFHVKKVEKIGFLQITFPFGWSYYDVFDGLLRVSAKGYETVYISDNCGDELGRLSLRNHTTSGNVGSQVVIVPNRTIVKLKRMWPKNSSGVENSETELPNKPGDTE